MWAWYLPATPLRLIREEYLVPVYSKMSLVTGEDSESDEEINTDQLIQEARNAKKTSLPRAGLVAGEDSEEEEG